MRRALLGMVLYSAFYMAQITQARPLHNQRHEIELVGNFKTMPASRSKVVAFVVIAFYFLIQELQTET